MATIDTHAPGSFSWFELATTDQAAAKHFYHSLFGWEIHDSPMGPDEIYTIFRVDGRDVAAAYTMRPEQRAEHVPSNWLLYITVENADAAAARASSLGGTVLAPPFDVMQVGRMAVIQDPTGALFAAWQPKGHSGTGIGGVDHTVCWADLLTPDPVRAATFYTGLFGWHITAGKNMKPAGPHDYGHIVNGTDFIGGLPPARAQHADAPAHWMIYIEVADCAAMTGKAKSLGAHVLVDTMAAGENRKIAILGDPQGAVFALSSVVVVHVQTMQDAVRDGHDDDAG